jgi:hypothetical protein
VIPEPQGRAFVRSLVVNGKKVSSILFDLEGPRGDRHTGFRRPLSGHDTEYRKRYDLPKGTMIANTRTWTGIAAEEIEEVEKDLSCRIPPGVLLENFTLDGFPSFSHLKPGSQLVFPK